MCRVVIETAKVETNIREAGKKKVSWPLGASDNDEISIKTYQTKYLFLKLVAAMKLPTPENPKIFQTGEMEVVANTQTGEAEVSFFVHELESDLVDSISERYADLKSAELKLMKEAADLANGFSEEMSDQEKNKVSGLLEKIMEKSVLLKKVGDVGKIEELGLVEEEGGEVIVDNKVAGRLKKIILLSGFNCEQSCYKAYVDALDKKLAKLIVFDDEQIEREVFVPFDFNNTKHQGVFISHYLSKKPFDIFFGDASSLKVAGAKEIKMTPQKIDNFVNNDEALTIFKAYLDNPFGAHDMFQNQQ